MRTAAASDLSRLTVPQLKGAIITAGDARKAATPGTRRYQRALATYQALLAEQDRRDEAKGLPVPTGFFR